MNLDVHGEILELRFSIYFGHMEVAGQNSSRKIVSKISGRAGGKNKKNKHAQIYALDYINEPVLLAAVRRA